MTKKPLHERITDQFSYQGDHADIWRGFDLVLDTDEFLNMGYSKWYQPHVFGSPQRRLATKIGTGLTGRLGASSDVRLLDIGCGRGGPSINLAETFGLNVTGIDLVPYNVREATDNAKQRSIPVEFVVGDAMRLPFSEDAFSACTAIDSIVYMPAKDLVFENVVRVVRSGGVVAISDLVMQNGVSDAGRQAVDAFTDSWDMPSLLTVDQYCCELADVGLTVEQVMDISANSISRFRKWTRLYLALIEHAGDVVTPILDRGGLDATEITEQVRTANAALPHLCHVIIYARN